MKKKEMKNETDKEPNFDDSMSYSVKFLLEEYRNIADTHDKLRDLQTRLFNFFLLMSAFPFTLLGILYKDKSLDLLANLQSLSVLFIVVGAGHMLLTLSLVDARLSQYRYARTVNLVRRYFLDLDSRIANYLFLPTREDVPRWEDLGYVKWERNFMLMIGALFVAYGISGFSEGLIAKGVFASIAILLYWLIYFCLQRKSQARFKAGTDIHRDSQT